MSKLKQSKGKTLLDAPCVQGLNLKLLLMAQKVSLWFRPGSDYK